MNDETLKLYHIPEIAKILGLHERTVLAYCETGKLKARKIVRRWTMSAANLREFVNTATNTAAVAN